MIEDYALFLAKTATVVAATLVVLAALGAQRRRTRSGGWLRARTLNGIYKQRERALGALSPRPWKERVRELVRSARGRADEDGTEAAAKRVFILEFEGDIRARAVEALREEVTSILTTVRPEHDEVVIKLESPGGLVPAYGLAAAQLVRLRERGVELTVCVDRVAASGGYLMAAVANRVIAAPFALVGSIGVVGSLPNFHRWLKNRDIDFEQHTAGEHKRTLTVFGENTEEAREKFREDLVSIHEQFKRFIARYRPAVDIEEVATGEYWLAEQALERGLVDQLQTSDDYLMAQRHTARLVELHYHRREGWSKRLVPIAERLLQWRNP